MAERLLRSFGEHSGLGASEAHVGEAHLEGGTRSTARVEPFIWPEVFSPRRRRP